jgi:hypothetical protein
MRAMLATDKARPVEVVSLILHRYACLTAGCRAKSAEAAFSRLERYFSLPSPEPLPLPFCLCGFRERPGDEADHLVSIP